MMVGWLAVALVGQMVDLMVVLWVVQKVDYLVVEMVDTTVV